MCLSRMLGEIPREFGVYDMIKMENNKNKKEIYIEG